MDEQTIVEETVVTEETAVKAEAGKGKSIAALILGIASIVANLPLVPLPFAWVIGLVCTIISKVLIKKAPDSGLKKGAKITSTIGLILTIVWAAAVALIVLLYIVYIILVSILGIGLAFTLPFLG